MNMTMLTTLKETGKSIGTELGRTWGNLTEGWRELLGRSSAALTQFRQHPDELPAKPQRADSFPRWSLLAGELEETKDDVWVRIELPGMARDDCEITFDGNMLHVRGEKRMSSDVTHSTYRVMERAYGFFQRSIPLPGRVNADKAEASFKNGVLTVHLPKEGPEPGKSIPVTG